MTDEELVRKMQRGDMQAFDELYERYKDDAYRVACLITGNRAEMCIRDRADLVLFPQCVRCYFTAAHCPPKRFITNHCQRPLYIP